MGRYGIKQVKGITIKGFDSLIKKLDALPETIIRGVIEGVNVVAEEIQKSATDKVVGVNVKLMNSIDVVEAKDYQGIVKASVLVNPDVYGSVPVPSFIEMGTGPIGAASTGGSSTKYPLPASAYRPDGWTYYNETGEGMKDGKPGYVYTLGQPAHPFLYPAFVEHAPFAKQTIADYINAEIDKVKG